MGLIFYFNHARVERCWVLWRLVGLEFSQTYSQGFAVVGRLIKKAYPRHGQSRGKGGIANDITHCHQV